MRKKSRQNRRKYGTKSGSTVDQGTGGAYLPQPQITRWSDTVDESVVWVIPELIPRDGLTLLVGVPGCGKSLLSQTWAGELSLKGITTLLLSAEDHPTMVIAPRLSACAADKSKVIAPKMTIRLPERLPALAEIVEHQHPGLIVLDLLNSFSSKSLSHDGNAHLVLGGLIDLAVQQQLAILGVVHTAKTKRKTDIHRILGSIELAGMAGSIVAVEPVEPDGDDEEAEDQDEDEGNGWQQLRLRHLKCNLGPLHATMYFHIETVTIDNGIAAPRIVFHAKEEESVP